MPTDSHFYFNINCEDIIPLRSLRILYEKYGWHEGRIDSYEEALRQTVNIAADRNKCLVICVGFDVSEDNSFGFRAWDKDDLEREFPRYLQNGIEVGYSEFNDILREGGVIT